MDSRITTAVLSIFISVILASLIAPSEVRAQNLLVDGGFDSAPQTQFGDRFDVDLSPWMFATVSPTAVIQNTQNLVAVDGPGGHDYHDRGPESDASGAPAGVTQYYIDSGSIPLYGWQYFTPSCRGTATATMKVTNREGHGEAGPTRTGAEVPPQAGPFTFRSTQGGLAVLQVSNEIPAFPVGFGVAPATTAQLIIALKNQFDAEKMPFLLTAGKSQSYPWTPMTVQTPVAAGQLYAFMAELGHSVNMDNASVELDCDDPIVPVPTDISIEKTCTPPLLGQHNGVDGLFWDCVIDVQASGPMPAFVHVNEQPSSGGGGTTVQTLSMTPLGGGGDCSGGGVQSCIIYGANFDPAIGAQFSVQLFLAPGYATNLSDMFTAQNCALVGYYPQAGTFISEEACVQADWTMTRPPSVLSATKSCEPLVATPNGTYQMSCQFDVTATGQPAGNYILAADFFTGLPPVNATITGTMMNVTSNEPWNCVDLQLNTPASSGICELSAADMLAAGGQSSFNVMFEFSADQATGQVANCPMSQSTPESYIERLNGRSSEPALRSPQSDPSTQLPDGCVVLDLPTTGLTSKIERAEMTKSCDQPQQAVINGALGYTWDCQASITVIPTPFAGTFTFDDDASNISIGTAQFLSASEPNCQGIGTDQLSCTLNGTAMTSPRIVTYQLFTELTDPNQPIEWENCIKGRAETAAGEYPTVPMCVGRVIKPEIIIDDPEPKEITLTKKCGRPSDAQHDGVNGKRWSCEVTVTANPAPFSGIFSFLEDASNVSGTTSANIIGYQSSNAGWNCGGTFPQPQTQCGILGGGFSPSGVETISFDLFAANQGNSVKWENCVSATYTNASGEKRGVKGNCVGTDWEATKEPPVIPLKKGCRATGAENGNSYYLCSIYVSPPRSGVVTGPLTLDELFTTASGASATQYIQGLTGTPAAPNGWLCQQPAFTNGASCTISATDFNGNTGHRIDAQIMIPTAVLQKEGFKNCAQVRISDQVIGSADCVDIVINTDKVEFDVEKTCKPSGDRLILGATGWTQAYQCTLTVTTNGVPFTDPLWVTEDLHFGTNSGAGQIQSITSADPWSCSSPPYSAPGQGNVPYCGIQGAQFPASGTSTLTVDLMMNSAMDQFGAENCVSLSVGAPTANGLPAPIANDCFEIAQPSDPKEPSIDLVKACSPAQQSTPGQWTVACTLTITGQNLPAGQQVRVTDELMSSSTQTAFYGQVMGPTNACGGGQMNGGTSSACDITTDDINAAPNGVLTIPFTGTYQGPAGRPINGAQAQNCAFVDVNALGLHGPTGGNGKSCVPVTFSISSIGGTGPIIGTPVTPTGPIDMLGGVSIPNLPIPSATITKTCEPLIFAAGAQLADAVCTIEISTQNLVPGQIVNLSDALTIGNSAPTVPHHGPFMTLINSPIWACANAQPAGTSAGQCFMSSDDLISMGSPLTATWTAQLLRDDVNEHRGLKNCVTLTIGGGTPVTSCANFEVVYADKSQEPTPPALPQSPSLTIIKEQTGPCGTNRASQTYDCGFRLSVINTGTGPYIGPLVMTDTAGNPGIKSATAVSGNGWSCGAAVRDAVSCTNAAVNLTPGASTHVDLRMKVKGLRNGGMIQNCATTGVTDDRRQRVALVQKIMNDRGLEAGPVDGDPGRKTYTALAKLRADLGLPISRAFDDALFKALGLPLQAAGQASCVTADLAPTPAPPLQCNTKTTVRDGESCACRYDNMDRSNVTSCQCRRGFALVAGKGCQKRVVPPKPAPTPTPPPKSGPKCDLRSTYLRGDVCSCIDHKTARNISKTQCGCTNGLPMVNGKCIPIKIRPKPEGDGPAGAEGCRIKINGICIK